MALKIKQKTVGNAFQLKVDPTTGDAITVSHDDKVQAALEHDNATALAIEESLGDPSDPETLEHLAIYNRERDADSQITPEMLGEMKPVVQRAPTSFATAFAALDGVNLSDTVTLLKEDICMIVDVSTPDEIADLLDGDGLPSGYFDAASYIAQLNVVYPFVAPPPVPKRVETGIEIDKTSDLSNVAIAAGVAAVAPIELGAYMADAALDVACDAVDAAADCIVDLASGLGEAAGGLLDGLFGGGGFYKWVLIGVAGVGSVVALKMYSAKKAKASPAISQPSNITEERKGND